MCLLGVRVIVDLRRAGSFVASRATLPHRVDEEAIPTPCTRESLMNEDFRSRFGRTQMRPKHFLAAIAGTATISVAAVVVAVIDYFGSQTAATGPGSSLGADGRIAGAGLPFGLVRRYRDRTKVE